MTSRYRVEYALKSHRRDEFIEWIKGLLAVPFVLHADVENYDEGFTEHYSTMEDYEKYLEAQESVIASECQIRYQEIFADVEKLVDHTIVIDDINEKDPERNLNSRLRKLVPSVGRFFTPLPLTEAFLIEDERRSISKRRLVSPSFNDIRVILNTAQVLALTKIYKDHLRSGSKLKLITFDGDVTLYEDGKSLEEKDPVVQRLVKLLSLNLFVSVVTAAGYPGQQGAAKYHERLRGLLDALNRDDCILTPKQKENLLVMGGESNYLFRYSNELKTFEFIDAGEWHLPVMLNWDKQKITFIMETIGKHLLHLQKYFNLESTTTLIKKERSIGIIPNDHCKILREHLEEMVLSCSNKLDEILTGRQLTDSGKNGIRVCAFNGGSDVWVDIGDKSLGVEALQRYLCQSIDEDDYLHNVCPILKSESLHIGDQFASLGANDFKARLSACTVWIANPRETVAILDDLINYLEK
ncbi:IMP 5'-nucleotidase [Scheffersomyces amazonensis]|uniref:IMP 5'-nucleotidase n=1 Tax=Scheffersomyces amazonensis TaxID=1078765 RepID=UPI00315C5CE6